MVFASETLSRQSYYEPAESRFLRSASGMRLAGRLMMADSNNRADGSKMRAAREAKGWSQEDLAKQSGYALSVIQKLEQGTYFSLRCLECCAEALGVLVADLLASSEPLPGTFSRRHESSQIAR